MNRVQCKSLDHSPDREFTARVHNSSPILSILLILSEHRDVTEKFQLECLSVPEVGWITCGNYGLSYSPSERSQILRKRIGLPWSCNWMNISGGCFLS